MTRVLVVLNDMDDYRNHRAPIIEGAVEAGYDVHVAVPETSFEDPPDVGATFHAYHLDRASLNPVWETRALWSLTNLVSEVEPDLLHPFTIKPVIYGGLAARWAGTPGVVSTITGLGWVFASDSLQGTLVEKVVKQAYRAAFDHPRTVVFFQNRDDRQLFVDEGLLDASTTRLVPGSGVDTDRFHPSGGLPRPPVVMLPSRMIYDKGVDDFVEAARHCKEDGIEGRFVLVGESDPGNPNAIPPEQLKTWDDEGPVEWWGWSDDMPSTLNQASIVCLPTRYREGIPKVLLEAAAAGRPLVSTDVPGCREIVEDGVTGRFVEPGEPRRLARVLQNLINQPERLAELGANARQIAEKEYDVDTVLQRTLEAYRELTDPP